MMVLMASMMKLSSMVQVYTFIVELCTVSDDDLHFSIPDTGFDPLHFQVTLVAGVFVVSILPGLPCDETVLLGSEAQIAVEEWDDLHGNSIQQSN